MFYYEDVLRALNRARVDYVVFGGVAAILYGIHRSTMDIDIMIDLESKNITKFFKAITDLGYSPKVPVTLEEFTDPKIRKTWIKDKNMKVLSFYHKKDNYKMVDVSIGQLMNYAHVEKKIFKISGIKVPVIAFEQLVKLKKKAGRPQDLIDLDELRRVKELNDD